ncbi:MAG: hypothetical protein C5B59_12470 [Bacteroidetes bacterium]|nr:MAG: hypothetical protein C5B59_12470 [Bacteroidota bacterium]
MLRKLTMLVALLGIVMIYSCGTKKKLEAAMSENEQLRSKNTELNNTITGLQKQVSDLTATNQSLQNEFASYKTNCQETEKKLQAVRDHVSEQMAIMQGVEKRLEDALANFRDKGVDVFLKDGLVYVSMADNLLFRSGSSVLSPNCRAALEPLSNVLNEYPKLRVIVVGNTDDQQFKKGGGDNWTLSTERANVVVRALRDDFKVDPSRLTAAGKSKYNPVADNTTADGRAKNRRTDIVLNPDLERIWNEVKESKE